MREKYIKQLEATKAMMEKAEAFAEKIPLFEEKIIDGKITGEEYWYSFGEKYKTMRLAWGIRRGFYSKNNRRYVTNYEGDTECYLFNIYINTLDLFDSHYSVGLNEIANKVPLFFYDGLNSTFYATDEQITDLLEAIHEWYLVAKEEVKKLKAQEALEKAMKEVEKLQNTLNQ